MDGNKHSGSYEVAERQPMGKETQQVAWCQIGLFPYMTVISFMVYIIGSIITGVSYRSYGLNREYYIYLCCIYLVVFT